MLESQTTDPLDLPYSLRNTDWQKNHKNQSSKHLNWFQGYEAPHRKEQGRRHRDETDPTAGDCGKQSQSIIASSQSSPDDPRGDSGRHRRNDQQTHCKVRIEKLEASRGRVPKKGDDNISTHNADDDLCGAFQSSKELRSGQGQPVEEHHKRHDPPDRNRSYVYFKKISPLK